MPTKTSSDAPTLGSRLSAWLAATGLGGSAPQWPDNIAQGIAIAQRENPDLADVQPYGPISLALLGQAQGYVSPRQTIYLNPGQLEGLSPEDVADTILREQTHVRQMRARGGSSLAELGRQILPGDGRLPYGQRPDEMAAFQAEKDRRYAQGRAQTPIPAFDGGYYAPQDTRLPRQR